MATLKTHATSASVRGYLDAIGDPARRQDCEALAALMQRVTQAEPVLWGPSIVGFGSYHYRYDSGHEGDACLVGFSARKQEIAVYLAAAFASREALLKALGKHKTGKACLYLKRLSDLHLPTLEQLVRDSVAELRRQHPA